MSLARKMVTGLLATTLVICGGLAVWAAPPPHPHHPHPGWYPPVIYPYVKPYVKPIVVQRVYPVVPTTTYYVPDTSNPAPPADIRLVNPAGNRATLKYLLDGGPVRSLPPGLSVAINRAAVIEFDRGGGAGRARYSLTDGTYRFTAAGGAWNLVRDDVAPVADIAANPLPAN